MDLPPPESCHAFQEEWNVLSESVHANACKKDPASVSSSIAEKLARIHGSIARILNAIAKGNPQSHKIPGYSFAEEDAAEAAIGLMNLCETESWDVAGAIVAKHRFDLNKGSSPK